MDLAPSGPASSLTPWLNRKVISALSLSADNHFFSASPTNSNNALVAGSSGRPRSALILL